MSNFIDVIGKNFALKNATKKISGVPVKIKTFLDIDTFANVVQSVAQTCIQGGEFHAENREIARRFVIIKYFTDIDVTEDDIGEVFKCSQSGNWFTEIEREVIKLPVWAEIELAIDRQIDCLITTRPTAFDKLCSDLSAIISTDQTQNLADIKDVLDGLNKVDKEGFVKAVVEQNIAKNKGGENNGKKPEGTTD